MSNAPQGQIEDASVFLRALRRRCRSKDLYALLEQAARSPEFRWGKFTRSGVILAGPGGTVGMHLTPDTRNRAFQNGLSMLRRAGLLDR